MSSGTLGRVIVDDDAPADGPWTLNDTRYPIEVPMDTGGGMEGGGVDPEQQRPQQGKVPAADVSNSVRKPRRVFSYCKSRVGE